MSDLFNKSYGDESNSNLTHPLERVETFIRRFIVLPDESDYTLVVLWIAHTYFTHLIKTTPRLAIISPEYGCGKSRVLEVLESLSFKGEKLDYFSRSYLMRTVDSVRLEFGKSPTLLIDELDSVWGRKGDEGEAVRAFTNSGYRDSGFYGITEGEGKNRKPTKFRTFAPMVLAGKGEIIPESVVTRGLTIRLQKRRADQSIEDFLGRIDVTSEAEELRELLSKWADSAAGSLNFDPELPVRDRDREVWSPLFMMAELADESWFKRVELTLFRHLAVSKDDSVPRERQLLTDIRKIWIPGEDKLRSAHLLTALVSIPESEWSTVIFGKPITEKYLAKKLKTYGITPQNLRFGDNTYKGYRWFEIEKACKIYLPLTSEGVLPDTCATFEIDLFTPVASVADKAAPEA